MKKNYCPKNISVEFERDSALRATEVVIINHDCEGNERQGKVVLCYDNGEIKGGVNLITEVRILPDG